MAANIQQMLQGMSAGATRPSEAILSSNGQLHGPDAQKLKYWASQNWMKPREGLTDQLGAALMSTLHSGPFDALQTYIDTRLAALGGDRPALVQQLYQARWGSTRIPIYNVILVFLNGNPKRKQEILNLTRYLAQDLKVPVDGTDVIGAPALYWAISTKPFAEPEFAQILFDAGGSVNQKNRFGGTAASEIVQSIGPGKAVEMMRWYVQHGGDVHSKDNDGVRY
ncbi:hypothetical protein N0V90_012414 [Kalmusia sp. IMI 367209]|nr:hypothetical protein N0V90_012414 [Kalmusia sp. IMI 367209]